MVELAQLQQHAPEVKDARDGMRGSVFGSGNASGTLLICVMLIPRLCWPCPMQLYKAIVDEDLVRMQDLLRAMHKCVHTPKISHFSNSTDVPDLFA